MKKITLFLFIIISIIISSLNLFAQENKDLKLTMSNKIQYDRKKLGFLKTIEDFNDKFVYATFKNKNYENKKKSNTKYSVVVFDKVSMKKVASTQVLDQKINKGREFYQLIAFDDVVYIITKEDIKGNEKFYVASFSSTMSKIGTNKLLSSIKTSQRRGSSLLSSSELVFNKKSGSNIAVVNEKPNVKGSPWGFSYKVFNKSLSEIGSGDILTEYQIKRSFSGSIANYSMENDGNIFARVKIDNYEGMKDYSVLVRANILDKKFRIFPIVAKDKFIDDYTINVIDNKLEIFGLYSLLVEIKNGLFGSVNHIKGSFRTSIDLLNEESTPQTNFNEFDINRLESIFSKNNTVNKSVNKNKETLSGNYEIEKTLNYLDGSSTLICTYINNYSVTRTETSRSSNGGTTTSTRTENYCEKNNIFMIHYNKIGSIDWIENIPRKVTYSGTDVKDITAIENKGTILISYGDAVSKRKSYSKNSTIANLQKRKSKESSFIYAIVNKKNGSYTYDKLLITSKKGDRININDPLNFKEIDNKIVFENMQIHNKLGIEIVSCVTLPVIVGCCIYTITTVNGTIHKGFNNIGVLELKD